MSDGCTLTAAGNAIFLKVIEQPGNVAVSPLSLSLALEMVDLGVTQGSSTQDELRTLLYPSQISPEIADHKKKVQNAIKLLSGMPEDQLVLANSVWASGDVNEEFKTQCADKLGAEVFSLASAATINEWISENTCGRINELLTYDPRSSVLVNALYFGAPWFTPFAAQTSNVVFNKFDDIESLCTMMSNNSMPGRVLDDGDDTIIGVPYEVENEVDEDSDIMAVLVLPKNTGREALLQATQRFFEKNSRVYEDLDQPQLTRFNLSMPAFEIDSNVLSLKKTLEDLGVTLLFHAGSLKGMSTDDTSAVSDVLHRVVLKVDRHGTVAAAATAVATTRGGRGPPSYVVDRPFLFVVFETKTRATLFAAKVETVPGASVSYVS